MLRAAVLHVNSANRDSTSPTMRIARFVADELKIPLLYDRTSAAAHRDVKYDVLFVKYGVLKFSNHREDALTIYNNAKFIVDLENDYSMVPDKRFRVADEVWSTVEDRTRYCNWNILTRHPLSAWQCPRPLPMVSRDGLVYYGAFREDREPSFRRYFRDAPYNLTISTFRSRKKFMELCGDSAEIVGAFKDPDAAGSWPATIYMEDETSHGLYCSPATRFYECIMTGILQFIDIEAVETLSVAEIPHVDLFTVASKYDVRALLGQWEMLRKKQRELWFRDYSDDLLVQFRRALKDSFGAKAQFVKHSRVLEGALC